MPRIHDDSNGILLVVVAAAVLKVLFFVAVFPLFNNVDEVAHIDLVIKRDMGLPIAAGQPYAMLTRDLIFRYGYGVGLGDGGHELRLYLSPEFVDPVPESGSPPIPMWLAPAPVQTAVEPTPQAIWSTRANHEATELPLYYVMAARWTRLGQLLGLREARLLYWVRALNAAIAGLLVVVAAAFGRLCDPVSRMFCIGMPLLVAAFPQKVFYSITNDALSPLAGGLAVYCGLRLLVGPEVRFRDVVLTGLMVSLAILTKMTNVFLIVMIPAIIALRVRRAGAADAGRTAGWMLLSAAVPLVLWRIVAGSSAFRVVDKAAALGWTYRPAGELLDHPMFTLRGGWHFLSQLLKTFWRGEFSWHGAPLALPAMDAAFVACSLVLLGIASLRLVREPRSDLQRAIFVSLVVVSAGVLMMATLSLIFDFGAFSYPSRALPFFTSGRLIGAALLPFAALFLYGLEALVARTSLRRHAVLVLANLALAILVVDLVLSMDAIGSPYNWFHLR